MSSLALSSYSSFCSGMLPEAILPPSKEHSYAQWLERTYQPRESRGTQMGKTDSLLSPIITQRSEVSHSPPLYAHGMESYCVTQNCRLTSPLKCHLLIILAFSDLKCTFSLVLHPHRCNEGSGNYQQWRYEAVYSVSTVRRLCSPREFLLEMNLQIIFIIN